MKKTHWNFFTSVTRYFEGGAEKFLFPLLPSYFPLFSYLHKVNYNLMRLHSRVKLFDEPNFTFGLPSLAFFFPHRDNNDDDDDDDDFPFYLKACRIQVKILAIIDCSVFLCNFLKENFLVFYSFCVVQEWLNICYWMYGRLNRDTWYLKFSTGVGYCIFQEVT